jgi:hypothetical protein
MPFVIWSRKTRSRTRRKRTEGRRRERERERERERKKGTEKERKSGVFCGGEKSNFVEIVFGEVQYD